MKTIALLSIAVAARLSAAVTGFVITTDGAPLANVKVEAFHPPVINAIFQATPNEPLTSAVTGKDGAFSLNVTGSGLIDIRVLADGYVPVFETVVIDEQAGTIALRRATMVEGSVTANGKPVEGAKVWFVRAQARPVVLTTNAQGSYRVADPRTWAQSIVVLHHDFAPASHPPNTLTFALNAGRELRGSVVDADHRPVPAATVSVDEIQFARTDAEGKFFFPHVNRDSMAIIARAPNGYGLTRAAEGSPTVTLRPVVRVSGVVRDAEKRPLSGITVGVVSDSMPAMAVTDTSGAFTLLVPKGRYELYVGEAGPGYAADGASIDATAGDVRQDIVARRQVALTVNVRTTDGKPVPGAAISFLFGNGTEAMSAVPSDRVTGIDGSVRVPVPSERTMKVRFAAVKAGLPPAVSAPIADLSHPKPVTITIPEGIAVTGIVTGKDKHPLSEVRVTPLFGAAAPEDVPENANVQEPWATTDAEGRFHGRLTASTGGLELAKKGFVRVQKAIEVRIGIAPIEVQLAAASSISGKVVHKDGSPAPETPVQAGERFAITAPDGSFTLEELDAGPQVIRFGRSQTQQRSVNAPASDVLLTLPATRPVHGRVIDATTAAPVEKFSVAVAATDDYSFPILTESSAGEFQMEVPEGAVALAVSAPGYIEAKNVAVAADAKDPIVVRLSRGRTLRGRVVDEKHEPIAGVQVMSMNDMSPRATPLETSADGSFEVTGINPSDEVRIALQKDGYVKSEWRGRLRADETPVQIMMRNGLTFSGRVVDASGAGVPNAEVSAASSGYGAQMENAETDESGAFHFSSLAPARYEFTASVVERGQRGAAHDIDIEKVHNVTITLENRPTATIVGHVTGFDSSARPMVTATGGEDDIQSAAIDLSGNYRMENAPIGSVEVQAQMYSRHGARNSKRVTVDVAAGAEVRADLAFATPVSVHGHVTRGGTPIGGATVRFYGPGSVNAVAGPDGAYEAMVDSGDYDLSLASPDGKQIPFTKHVSITDAAEINLRVEISTVSARVIDADTGEPIAGAQLSASKHGETHTMSTSRTGSDGMTSLDVSPGEMLTITASQSGYANATQDVMGSDNQSIVLRMLHTPGAVVRIVDIRDGRTLSGYVIARDSSGRVLASASEQDPDGTVTLPILPGHYSISASAEGFGSHTVKADVPSGEIRVPLPRGGNLRLRSDNEVHGMARLIQPNGEEYVRCWCSGIAEIKIDGPSTLVDRISPGPYTLEVARSDGKTKRIPVSIIEGQTTVVTID